MANVDERITAQGQATDAFYSADTFLSRKPYEGNSMGLFYAKAVGAVDAHNFRWSVLIEVRPNDGADWVLWDRLVPNEEGIIKEVPETVEFRYRCDIFDFEAVADTPDPQIRVMTAR